MKIGFTGTRAGITESQLLELLKIVKEHDPISFHQGDCVGGDAQAWYIIRSHCPNIRMVCHPPDNPKARAYTSCDENREPRPYLVRNRDIVNETDLLIACPRGVEQIRSGTWSTIRYAQRIGKQVTVISP